MEEEQSEPSEAGTPSSEAPAGARSVERHGHATVTVQKLTAMKIQLQVRFLLDAVYVPPFATHTTDLS